MVTMQRPVPVHGPVLQPKKIDPGAGTAVKVTTVPVGNAATHVEPQSIPAGWLVTVPDPVPILGTVRVDMPTGVLNVAVTDRFTSITTEHAPVPLQSPLHPAKIEPAGGTADKATVLPDEKLALHVPGQDIPLGLLVTVPAPDPSIVTVSITGGGGAAAVKDAVTA
jgi:hypothetical protein